MAKTILFTAPYMISFLDRFRPVLESYGLDMIVPEVQERMEEADLLEYAGQFDGAICGDDRYTARVIEACAPRLKIILKNSPRVDIRQKHYCESMKLTMPRRAQNGSAWRANWSSRTA